ncbi:hypothetical protein QBC43DRAFT_318682 [Cladorrhinum sp. PSN259]|nr:hypothetical protein QBC43DRAFT_318682 [Cladorrhinum sp. PSN259]
MHAMWSKLSPAKPTTGAQDLCSNMTTAEDESPEREDDDEMAKLGRHHIFLCYGTLQQSQVFPASVGTALHDMPVPNRVVAWKRIQSAWYDRRGHWRKRLLPVYGVKSIELVEAQRTECCLSDKTSFKATLTPIDVQFQIASLQKIMDGYYDNTDPVQICDKIEHGSERLRTRGQLGADIIEIGYPEKIDWEISDSERLEIDQLRDQIKHLERTGLLTDAFHHPEKTRDEDIITNGYIYAKPVFSHFFFGNNVYFHAYWVKEGLLFDPLSGQPAFVISSCFVILLVVAHAWYQDWGIAWTAVGSIGTIVAVVISYLIVF